MKIALDTLRLAVVVMVCAVSVIALKSNGYFDPVPYRSVELVEAEFQDDGRLLVHARYIKTPADCEYVRGQAFVNVLGAREAVPFEPIRAEGQGAQRFVGEQALRWLINLDGLTVSSVEIWTRHNCGGTIVDQQMLAVQIH